MPLVEPGTSALMPVMIAGGVNNEQRAPSLMSSEYPTGSIHIELPNRAMISMEHGADKVLLSTVLKLLRN
jgi:hypothetical protein